MLTHRTDHPDHRPMLLTSVQFGHIVNKKKSIQQVERSPDSDFLLPSAARQNKSHRRDGSGAHRAASRQHV